MKGFTLLEPSQVEEMVSGNSNNNDNGLGDPSSQENNDTGDNNPPKHNFLFPETYVDNDAQQNPTPDPNTNPDQKPNSNPSPSSAMKIFLKELIDGDLIKTGDDFDLENSEVTLDTIKELINSTLDQNLKSEQEKWKSSLSPIKKKFLEIEDAFDDETMAIEKAEELEFLNNIDLKDLETNTNLQKVLYKSYLERKGFSKEETEQALKDADDLGNLFDKTKQAIPYLQKDNTEFIKKQRDLKIEQTERQKKTAEEKYNKLISEIDSRTEFIPGIQLTDKIKNSIKESMTKIVHVDEKTGREYNELMLKQSKNPVEFELLINFYNSIGLFDMTKTNNFQPNISYINNKAVTKKLSDLESVLTKEQHSKLKRDSMPSEGEDLANKTLAAIKAAIK